MQNMSAATCSEQRDGEMEMESEMTPIASNSRFRQKAQKASLGLLMELVSRQLIARYCNDSHSASQHLREN